MKPIIKNKFIMILLLIIIITTITFRPCTIHAEISESDPIFSEYVCSSWFIERDGNYIYQTYDVKKSSGTYYSTVAFEVSRLKYGVDPTAAPYINDDGSMTDNDPHYYVNSEDGKHTNKKVAYNYYTKNGQRRETIIFKLKQFEKIVTKDLPDGHQINTYVVSKDAFFSEIKNNHSEWYDELQKQANAGLSTYVGIDSIMVIKYEDKGAEKAKGYLWTTGQRYNLYDWSNWKTSNDDGRAPLVSAEKWGKQETIDYSIPTHFNNYAVFDIGTTDVPTPDDKTPDTPEITTEEDVIVKDGSDDDSLVSTDMSGNNYANPTMNTYHYDTTDTYNIGEAIPASQGFSNSVDASSWYGNAQIKKTNYNYTYKVDYEITWTEEGHSGYIGWTSDEEKKQEGDPLSEDYDSGCVYTGTNVPYEKVTIGDDGKEVKETWYHNQYLYTATKKIKHIYTGTVGQTLYSTFYSVMGLNLYELTGSTVSNNAYGSTNYNNDINISYYVSQNGVTASSDDGSMITLGDSDTSYHVQVPEIDESKITGDNLPEVNSLDTAREYAKEVLADRLEGKSIASTNDELYLNGTWYLTKDALNVEFDDNHAYYIGAEDGSIAGQTQDIITSTSDVTVPTSKENGRYWTDLTVNYKKFINSTSKHSISISDTEDNSDKIIKDAADPYNSNNINYKDNEPVIVKSPVISPISINGEEKTQLVNQSTATQLILDHSYIIKFDWKRYFSYKGYDVPAGYTEFVKNKQLRFPFSVMIDNVYYEPDESTGYTQWIDFNGDTTEVTIYIPSWSKEGVYGEGSSSTAYNYIDRRIQVRCFANNYPAGEWANDFTDSHNAIDAAKENDWNYIATYEYPIEISGILYDFTVGQINDELVFKGITYNDVGMTDLVEMGHEKSVGLYNRFGTNVLRSPLDGNTKKIKNVDTLPFTNGKSNILSDMGYLQPGHKFAFFFKTIANLNTENDSVTITPSFRYISNDGKGTDQVNVYYLDNNNQYVKIGSKEDKKNLKTLSIGDMYFNNSKFDYNNNTVSYTASKRSKTGTENEILNTESGCFSPSIIKMPAALSLLTGNEEELACNVNANNANAARYNGSLGTITNYDTSTSTQRNNAFLSSMQTWYGEYQIPPKIFVCKRLNDGTYEDMLQKKIAEEGWTSEDDDIWMNGGYLVLNFKITSYVNGNKHLAYYGGNDGYGLSLWTTEAGAPVRKVRVSDIYTVNDVPVYDGDVAIITLNSTLSDRYTTGTLYYK